MDSIDEVLESPTRIRVVLAARGTPRDEMCVAATLRAVDNGQQVLFFTSTELGQRYMRHEAFPPVWNAGNASFFTLDWVNNHKFVRETTDELASYLSEAPATSLIVIKDPFIYGSWSQKHLCDVLRGLLKKTGARLLIVSLPFHISGKRLAYSRLYRLCRQMDIAPDLIDVWRWPSPMTYRDRFGYWYTPEMVQREMLARWKDDS